MEVVHRRCCGVDVHKKTVVACRRVMHEAGKLDREVRVFGTMTKDLRALGDWMSEAGMTHVAMESTGVYWKPIWSLLAGRFEVLLVNARPIKQVPGRKTDVNDCEWIAQLLQHGLLRGSFVPEQPIRELRDLTRHRVKLVGEHTSVVNRIHKTLEDANIKLGSVASDIMGASGRAMLQVIAAGEDDARTLADLAERRLRGKIPELRLALDGRITNHHRFMLKNLMRYLDFLEAQIAHFDERVEELTRPFQRAIRRLMTMPGVQQRTAENLLAEVGPDMRVFPSAAHLASWAGICPGNNESAGKRRSGRTPKGSRWLRRALAEATWAAALTKDTYLSARYSRLARRRGKKRAVVAVGHRILVAVYHILKSGVMYRELGANFFDQLHPARLTRHLVHRLERLGHMVTLQQLPDAA